MDIKMENRIKDILKDKKISVLKLSNILNMNYASVHNIVNREDLGATQAKTLAIVAKALDVKITDLWKE